MKETNTVLGHGPDSTVRRLLLHALRGSDSGSGATIVERFTLPASVLAPKVRGGIRLARRKRHLQEVGVRRPHGRSISDSPSCSLSTPRASGHPSARSPWPSRSWPGHVRHQPRASRLSAGATFPTSCSSCCAVEILDVRALVDALHLAVDPAEAQGFLEGLSAVSVCGPSLAEHEPGRPRSRAFSASHSRNSDRLANVGSWCWPFRASEVRPAPSVPPVADRGSIKKSRLRWMAPITRG